MSLQDIPSSERVHIGLFGSVNSGKSSLLNAITASELALVSDIPGTTTDPVIKSMEILPLGPVVFIDTPGFDDDSALGQERIRRTKRELARCDVALLVSAAGGGLSESDEELLALIKKRDIPYLVVRTKKDLVSNEDVAKLSPKSDSMLYVSSLTGEGIHELKETLGRIMPEAGHERSLVSDMIEEGDLVVMVCPIDESAPKGRLILPQQLALRDILDAGARAIVTSEPDLAGTLSKLAAPPDLVITDSQAFETVNRTLPREIHLTSFSILMARYKGYLDTALDGIRTIENLKDGDVVLMAEGCTHHRQCGDIGTVKIPNWLKKHTGKELIFETCSGRDFPEDLSRYALVIHCGGCMITEADVKSRMDRAIAAGVSFTNYGIVIATITGALERCIS